MLNNVWVVAVNERSIPQLAAAARSLAHEVVLVFEGEAESAVDADRAYRLIAEDGAFKGSCVAALAPFLEAESPDAVLVESCKDGRLIAGGIAARFRASVFAEASELIVDEEGLIATRMVYGGGAYQMSRPSGMAIVTVTPGNYEKGEATPCGDVVEIGYGRAPGIEVSRREAKTSQKVDLSNEKVVVGVGRGMGSADGVPTVEKFAATIGAGIGCSRPVGEEERWFGDTGYLGISGDVISPDVYIACGISGQVQHMVGVNSAQTIFAINKDPKATIFTECDYGIVADMNELLPRLVARFEQE